MNGEKNAIEAHISAYEETTSYGIGTLYITHEVLADMDDAATFVFVLHEGSSWMNDLDN